MLSKDMKFSKKKLWLVELPLLAALLPTLFVSPSYCRLVAAAILAAGAGVTVGVIRKRRTPSVHYRQVMGLLAVIAVVYLVLTYVAGIRFGFYQNHPVLSGATFLRYILPAAAIILATEIIRSVLLAQDSTAIAVATYILCILSDLLLGQGLASMGNIFAFLDVVGLTLFPSITSNLLYHYLAKRYGAMPIIIYRLLLSVSMSFLPIIPAIPDAITAFVLMLLPLAVWSFIDLLYEKKVKMATRRTSKWSIAGLGVTLVCMMMLILMVSGQFRYKLMVIATPSMTGELNVGDAILYEDYDDQLINEGDVVVFTKDDRSMIVHRVVEIKNLNGQLQYFTKGDANEDRDSGYITETEIRGVVLCKVPHIGHPSLWLRGLFS